MNVIHQDSPTEAIANIDDSARTIELGRGYVATVNYHTYDRLRLGNYKWRALVVRDRYVYAVRYAGGLVYLHRLIAGALPGQQVDHEDRDTLNCRDKNLRIATPLQNRANQGARRKNSSGFKGVAWERSCRKWVATITHKAIRYYLGAFRDPKRAALAHDRAALAIHGEFAGLNFPGRKIRAMMPTGGYPVGKRKE